MRPAIGVVAILAALIWAPSTASAAGNNLHSPQVSPGSGSPTTVFAFRVGYEGTFAATGVRAVVAGRDLAMIRVAGSPTSGTWSVASVLPAGSWQVAFRASVTQGNSPSLAGPTVVVGGGTASAPPSGPSPDLVPGPGPVPPPSATPAPVSPTPSASVAAGGAASPAPSGVAATSAAAASSTAAASPAVTPGSVGGAAGAPLGGGWSGAPGAGAGGADGAPAATPAASDDPSEAPTGGATPGARSPSTIGRDPYSLPEVSDGPGGQPSWLILVGLSGVAALALGGTLLLAAGRRRSSTEADTAGHVDTVLEQRTLRRARMRLDDDPIIVAMGIGTEDEGSRRSGTPQVDPGEPLERP